MRTLKRLLPRTIREWLAWLRAYPASRRLAADRRSRATIRHASRPGTSPSVPRPVRVRGFGADTVYIRPGTSDAIVALATFLGQFHVPPREIGAPSLIWDLGANIGLTMTHMARLFPAARVVGVELDPANASVAKTNLSRFGDRCSLIEAAVWPEDGTVRFERQDGAEDGTAVRPGGSHVVRAVSLNSLLEATGPPDYVKIDIEGAEAEVLRRGTEWAAAVRSIGVECHPPYTLQDCAADLRRLGFQVRLLPQTRKRRARDAVVGIRQMAASPPRDGRREG